jgi:hypothetical protein
LPFKCNLQRYAAEAETNADDTSAELAGELEEMQSRRGSARWNQVDP